MQLLMLNTVFLGGLHEDIHIRLLEEGPTKHADSVKLAREIKSIMNDRRKERGFNITSIAGPEEDKAEDVCEVNKDEVVQLCEVNAILRKKGRPQ